MKSTYISSTNSLRELPQMEKPKRPNPYSDSIDAISLQRYKLAKDNFDSQMPIYTKHIASLRTISVSGDHNWNEGDVLTEGVDYEVKNNDYLPPPIEEMLVAIPLKPVSEDEDRIWQDLFLHIHITAQRYEPPSGGFHPGLPNDEKWHRYTIEELKSKYSLTKKQ